MPAARDVFSETITFVDPATGALKPLNNAQITVKLAGTEVNATIYAARDPNNATQVANPFTTGATGLVEFWAPQGEYEVRVHDLNAPARIADKTIGWGSMPAAAGALASTSLAADAGLTLGVLGAAILRQVTQIGQVIDWWRPAATVPLPSGFEICDGRQILAANHDFPGVANINLPDLRNKMVLGANSANADGSGGTASDVATAAPGIGGTGGSMTKNLQHSHDLSNHTHDLGNHTHDLSNHTHTIAHTHDLSNHTHTIAHTHSVNVPAHYHGKGTLNITSSGGHAHEIQGEQYTPGGGGMGPHVNPGAGLDATFFNTTTGAGNGNHTHPSANFAGSVGNTGGSNGDAAMSVTSGATSAANSGAPSVNSTGASSATNSGTPSVNASGTPSTNTSGTPSTNSTSNGLTTTQDIRPAYVGLLKLMKVKRS